MSNSTAVAATIGVGALGVLAYYGYQNLGGKTEDVQVGVLYNDILNNNNEKKSEEKDLQTQAKEEVAKARDRVDQVERYEIGMKALQAASKANYEGLQKLDEIFLRSGVISNFV